MAAVSDCIPPPEDSVLLPAPVLAIHL